MAKGKAATTRAPGNRLVHEYWFRHAAWSPDGARFALGAYEGPTMVCDAASGETIAELACQGHGVAFSPDGARLLAGSSRGAVVWDLATTKKTLTLKGHKHNVNAVAWSRDGARLVTGSGQDFTPADWSVRTWDATTGAEFARAKCRSRVDAVAIAPDGRCIAAVGGRFLSLWDGDAAGVVRQIKLPTTARSVAFTADGARALVACEHGPLCVVDPAAGAGAIVAWWNGSRWADGAPPEYVGGWRVGSVAGAGSGSLAAVAHVGDDASPDGAPAVSLVDIAAREVRATCRGADGMTLALAFSPDGARVLAAGSDGTAQVFDAHTGAMVIRPEVRALDAMERVLEKSPNALVALGPSAWAAVIARSDAPDARARAIAARLAGRAARVAGVALAAVDPSAPARLRAAAADPDAVVRRNALESLAAPPGPAPDDVLELLARAAATDADVETATVAARAYARLAPVDDRALAALTAVVDGPVAAARTAALYALRAHDARAMPLEWRAARDAELDPRCRAIENLSARGDAAREGALARVASAHEGEREAAMTVLGRWANEPAVRALLAAALRDPAARVRGAAAFALATHRAVQTEDLPALSAMARGSDWSDNSAALVALASAGAAGHASVTHALEATDDEAALGELISRAVSVEGLAEVVLRWAQGASDARKLLALQRAPHTGAAAAVFRPWIAAVARGKDPALRAVAVYQLEAIEREAERDE